MKNFVCKFFERLHTKRIKFNSKLAAQTLAEIVIVAGLSGIIAELEIPTLKLQIFHLETIAKLKKTYGSLSAIYDDAIYRDGAPDGWNLGNPGDPTGLANINNVMSKYLNVDINCGTGAGCFPDVKYDNLRGKDLDVSMNQDTTFTKMRLADGSSIAFTQIEGNCTQDWGDSYYLQNVCGLINIDINGNSKPNKYGEDMFGFVFSQGGITPLGTPMQNQNGYGDLCNTNINKNTAYPNGMSCTAWVMYKENFEYTPGNCDNNNSHAYVNDNNGKNNKNFKNGNDNSWNNGNNNCNYNL